MAGCIKNDGEWLEQYLTVIDEDLLYRFSERVGIKLSGISGYDRQLEEIARREAFVDMEGQWL